MRRTLVLAVVLVLSLLLAGCTGNETTTTTYLIDTGVTTTTESPTETSAASATDALTSTTAGSTSTTGRVSFEEASIFTADLSGAQVVPPVDTLATGSAIFKIDPTGTRAYFRLTLSNVTDVFASRVHEGKPGSNGQGLLILYPGPTLSGPYNGALAQGYFDASVLIGSLTGKTLADFAILLQSGAAYVNVGTVQNPEGEIRGQIHEEKPTDQSAGE